MVPNEFYVALIVFWSVICAVLLFFWTLPVHAQMVGPYLNSEKSYAQPTSVRCLSHKDFSEVLKSKGLRIIIVGNENSQAPAETQANKAIFANDDGSVVVANIFPDGRACVLDIIDNAAFSEEFTWKKPEKPTVPKEEKIQ